MLFQELLGYSLTPDTRHEVMVWMFGEGGNGKSVAISVVEALLGPMSMSIDFQTIGMPGNYDLADIPGKRVLLSTEAERNKTMAEGYIKRIVTGDTINTRPIYGSPLSFRSTAKIWWAMNDRPIIKDTTDSMWRRMKLIPFFRKFEEGKNADVDLPVKLMAELPGILNWAIEGLMRLALNGRFTKSVASEEAKLQYREEANPVAQWVNTMTVRTNYPATLQGALFKEYTRWCQEQNERAITSTQFGKDLKRLRIECDRKTAGMMYNVALINGISM
jgi:putative DNA primase/helicase